MICNALYPHHRWPKELKEAIRPRSWATRTRTSELRSSSSRFIRVREEPELDRLKPQVLETGMDSFRNSHERIATGQSRFRIAPAMFTSSVGYYECRIPVCMCDCSRRKKDKGLFGALECRAPNRLYGTCGRCSAKIQTRSRVVTFCS